MSVSVSVSDAWNSSFSNADNSVCNNVDELYPRANDHTSHNIVHQHSTGCFTSIITSSNILVTLYGPTYNMTSGAVCAVWTPQFSKYCNGVFSRISPDILNRFSQFFHRMKALWVQMKDLYLTSDLSRDVAISTK